MRRLVLYILLIFAVATSATGQNVTVTSSFDTSRIFIGDQIVFTVSIKQPADLKLVIPFFKDSLIKNIEILSGPVFDSTQSADGMINIIEKYIITSFDSGFYQVPPVFAEVKSNEGVKRFYSDYSKLEVMRLMIAPADTTAKIYDIIKPYRAPVTIGEIVPWVLIIALAAVLIWALIRLIKKLRKKKPGVVEVIIPDPAHIIAFRELEKLRNDEIWQKGEIKTYYTRLTEILRQYLENRFGILSLELTTAETLDALVKSGFKKDSSYTQLKTILTGADLVKFAKHNPEPAENDLHFQNSWSFIEITKEKEVIHSVADAKVKKEEDKL
jgi:hypothetical protein